MDESLTNSEMTKPRRLQPDTLATSVTILLVANIVQRTIGFGRGILFCRWLTPDELGTWEMAYSFLLLAAPIIVLGLPGSFGRYLERFRQQGQLRTFLRRVTVLGRGVADLFLGVVGVPGPRGFGLIFWGALAG